MSRSVDGRRIDVAGIMATGLAGVTALFAAVLVVKGRDNLSALPTPFSFLVVALIAAGLAGCGWAMMLALRAASGTPGDDCLLTGEDLQAWSRREADSIQRGLVVARRLMLIGVVLIAAAMAVAWLTPARSDPGSTSVVVNFRDGTVCGTLTGIGDGAVVVLRDGQYRIVRSGVLGKARGNHPHRQSLGDSEWLPGRDWKLPWPPHGEGAEGAGLVSIVLPLPPSAHDRRL